MNEGPSAHPATTSGAVTNPAPHQPKQAPGQGSGARTGATRGWTIGRLAGAPIVVTPAWFLAAALLTALFFTFVDSYLPGTRWWGLLAVSVSFVLILFVSVFCHEAAHALVAKGRGHKVTEIAVTLWGGHTQYTGRAAKPHDVIAVSGIGPVVSLGLAGLMWLASQWVSQSSVAGLLLSAGLFSNIFIGAFNFLPGLPLDGGQILEALVWRASGWRSRGTRVAGFTGHVLAVALVIAASLWAFLAQAVNYTVVVWSIFVAYFLWNGASEAIRLARLRESAALMSARTLALRAVVVPTGMSMADAAAASTGVHSAAVVVVDGDGQPLGWVDGQAAALIDEDDRATTPVDAAMVSFTPGSEVDVALSGTALLDCLVDRSGGSPLVAVTDGGAVVGIVDVAQVAQQLTAKSGK